MNDPKVMVITVAEHYRRMVEAKYLSHKCGLIEAGNYAYAHGQKELAKDLYVMADKVGEE
jgi:hypothetical protein